MSSLQVAALGAIAGFTIFLGLPFGRLQRPSIRLKAGLNGVAIGVLIFLEWDILTHAWEPVDAALADHQWASAVTAGLILAVGLSLGAAGLVYYDQRIVGRQRGRQDRQATRRAGAHDLVAVGGARNGAAGPAASRGDASVELERTSGWELAVVIACGIGLHNFSEGLAIGNSAASGELSLALLLIIGFGLHNATEGFGIVAPLAGDPVRPSWSRLALLGLIGGAPTFVGTLIGQRFVSEDLAVAFLALAAGSVLYVVIELLAVARRTGMKELTMWCILAGLGLGFLTDGILIAVGA
jgi:zinc transporter, ZIP family